MHSRVTFARIWKPKTSIPTRLCSRRRSFKTRFLKKCAGVLKKMMPRCPSPSEIRAGPRAIAKTASMCWFAGVNPTRMSKTCRSRLMEISKPQAVIISNWPPIHHHLTDRCWHGVMTTRVRNISQSACAYLPMVKMVTHNFWTQPARAAGQPTTNFCFMWLSMKIIVRIRSCATGWVHNKVKMCAFIQNPIPDFLFHLMIREAAALSSYRLMTMRPPNAG